MTEDEKKNIIKVLQPHCVRFRNRQGKFYAVVKGKFSHQESLELRKEVEKVLNRKIYCTSGSYGWFVELSTMTLRLNPDERMTKSLNLIA